MDLNRKIKDGSINLLLSLSGLIVFLLLLESIMYLPFPIFESFFDINKNTLDWYYIKDDKNIYLSHQPAIDFREVEYLYLYHGFPTCGNTGLDSCTLEICNYPVKKNTYRIVFIGDSVTNALNYGEVSNPKKIFTGIIKDKLSEISKTDIQFEVFNFGFGGANIEDISDYFQKIIECKPDLIIYIFCQNDLGYRWSTTAKPYALYKYSTKWYHQTRSFYLFSSSITNILYYNNNKVDYKTAENSINKITGYNNSKFLFIDLPYLNKGFKKENDFIRLYSTKYNITYLDLKAIFIKKNINPLSLRSATTDSVHLGYNGHEMVAEIIYEELFKNKLIPANKT
ncbi:MAG: SGNH/GDSL hydrolase family protein [Nanoarchaeota archaeon]